MNLGWLLNFFFVEILDYCADKSEDQWIAPGRNTSDRWKTDSVFNDLNKVCDWMMLNSSETKREAWKSGAGLTNQVNNQTTLISIRRQKTDHLTVKVTFFCKWNIWTTAEQRHILITKEGGLWWANHWINAIKKPYTETSRFLWTRLLKTRTWLSVVSATVISGRLSVPYSDRGVEETPV